MILIRSSNPLQIAILFFVSLSATAGRVHGLVESKRGATAANAYRLPSNGATSPGMQHMSKTNRCKIELDRLQGVDLPALC